MKIIRLTAAICFLATLHSNADANIVIFEENFDDSSGFTTSVGFFSDGNSDYFGIAGPSEDWGGGSTPSGLKSYTGFDGGFLTGQDLDGEGASLPITATWSGIDITGATGLSFSGDFAEFFDDPGDIDAADSLLVEAQIDSGGFNTILEFTPSDFSSGDFNGTFSSGGTTLGDAAQNFVASINGTGNSLDLRLTVSLDSGDEDFAADNFRVTAVPEPNSALLIGMISGFAFYRRRSQARL